MTGRSNLPLRLKPPLSAECRVPGANVKEDVKKSKYRIFPGNLIE